MRTIWKYPIQILPSLGFIIRMPKEARFLSVQTQGDSPQMWFTVDTDLEIEDRKFFVVETGEEIPKELFTVADYLGTFRLSKGDLVLHLFEVQDPIKALVRTIFTGQ